MEKYGQKPKKFTASWYEYIWEYYKLHIIIGILLAAAVVYTWVAIATRPVYDLSICITGGELINDGSKEQLKKELAEHMKDVNGDGEIKIKIADYSVSPGYDDAEYLAVMAQKLDLELQAGDAYLYIMPKDKAEEIALNPMIEGVFEERMGWTEKESDNKYFAFAGDSKFLKGSGIVYNDLYLSVKNVIGKKETEEEMAKRQNAKAAALLILGN